MPYLGGYDQQGGLFGSIGGFLGRTAASLIPGGNAVYSAASSILRRSPVRPSSFMPTFGGMPTGAPAPTAPSPTGTAQGAPRGYRLNKSSYHLKDGTFVPAGTKWVKVRRRNPANARALRRSLSRVESFGGLVKRTRKSIRKVKSL